MNFEGIANGFKLLQLLPFKFQSNEISKVYFITIRQEQLER